MHMRVLGIALAGLTMSVSLGAATTRSVTQQYYPGPGIYCFGHNECYPIAYSREVFSDPELTNLIGQGSDRCVQSGSQIYISTPQLPAGYEVATQMYVCSGFGPYLPPDW